MRDIFSYWRQVAKHCLAPALRNASYLTADQLVAGFGIDLNDWIRIYDNDLTGFRSQRAEVGIGTRSDRFYDVDSSACFDMRSLHSEAQDFYSIQNEGTVLFH